VARRSKLAKKLGVDSRVSLHRSLYTYPS